MMIRIAVFKWVWNRAYYLVFLTETVILWMRKKRLKPLLLRDADDLGNPAL
jgi:hypothetical protein